MNDYSTIFPVVIGFLSWFMGWVKSRKDIGKTKEKVLAVKNEIDSTKKELIEVKQDLTVIIESNGHYEEILQEILAIKRDLNDRIERGNEQLVVNADLYAKIVRYDAFFQKFFLIVKSQNKQLQDLYRKMN